LYVRCCVFFFFQAEDGIRDLIVTGVQTCALPILQFSLDVGIGLHRRSVRQDVRLSASRPCRRHFGLAIRSGFGQRGWLLRLAQRSEERRVGKECRSRWWAEQQKKKEDI